MTPLVITVTVEQRERLETLAKNAKLSLDAYVGELIDYAWYRWKPADGSEGTEITLTGVKL